MNEDININKYDIIKDITFYKEESISNLLVNKITNMIINEVLSPGYQFPNEIEMCQMLKIGRSSLREAYKVLESNGLIKRTKRGTFVNSKSNYSLDTLLNIEIKNSDFMDLLEFRMVVEGKTAYFAAERATPSEIDKLKKILERMNSEKNNITKFSFHDLAFHLKIAEMSHNILLNNAFQFTSEKFLKGINEAFLKLDNDGIERALDYHNKIYKCISEKRLDDAMKTMEEHVMDIMINTNNI